MESRKKAKSKSIAERRKLERSSCFARVGIDAPKSRSKYSLVPASQHRSVVSDSEEVR